MNIISREEARAIGAIRYFTNVPCKHGHVCERHTKSGTCVLCGNQKSKEWNNKTGYREQYRVANSDLIAASNKQWRQNNPDKVKQYNSTQSSRILSQLSQAKRRAAAKGLEFSLTKDDIIIPDLCPVLGIPISRSVEYHSDGSPSIDRVDSSKGYTKDNIVIISWRANRLKNDATADELRQIAEYMEKHNETSRCE